MAIRRSGPPQRPLILFEDDPDAAADLRRNHMSAHLAFLERNSDKVNAAGPLQTPSGQGAGGIWIVEADAADDVVTVAL